MHREAYEWVGRYATDRPVAVLDIGGRDINGTCRPLFPVAAYICVDPMPGPAVDVVADAATWKPDRRYDVVVCVEVLEHTPDWPRLLATAYRACRPGGRLVVTAAAPGRVPHSTVDGRAQMRPWEHYEPVEPERLREELESCGWTGIEIDVLDEVHDVRAAAVKGRRGDDGDAGADSARTRGARRRGEAAG